MKRLFSILIILAPVLAAGQVKQDDDYYTREKTSAKKDTSAPAPKRPAKENGIFDPANRTLTGGILGMQFGQITILHISPMVAYKLSEKVTAGVAGSVTYYYDNAFGQRDYTYGGRAFERGYVYKNQFYIQTEQEFLNGYWKPNERFNIYSLLLGGGIMQELGPRAYIDFTMLFNPAPSPYYPYRNPLLRGGFLFNL